MIGKFWKVQSRKSKFQSQSEVRGLEFEVQKPKTKNQKLKTKIESGFSLLELMIAMFILIILISVAMPTYQRSVQHARETVLKENLWQMRRSIDQYAADKGRLPQSVSDLVEGNYLREVPVDPISEKAEWKEIQGEDTNSPDGEQGLKDVKSLAEGEDSDGKKFEDY
ncbi:MAG TPA: type II secretion system protein [Pyrinomonadaceae bacterium]